MGLFAAVPVVKDLGALEEALRLYFLLEFAVGDEVVVDAILFVTSGISRRRLDVPLDIGQGLLDHTGEGRLPTATWTRYNE